MTGGTLYGRVRSAAPISPTAKARRTTGVISFAPGPGDLLVPSSGGSGGVSKVSSDDCSVQWTANTGQGYTGVVVHKFDAKFSIAAGFGEITRINNVTGEVEWSVNHDGVSGFILAIRPQGDLIFVGSGQFADLPGVTAYNASDGSQAWNAGFINENNVQAIAVDGQGSRVFFVDAGSSSTVGYVVALTATTGDREWTVEGTDNVGGPDYVVADHDAEKMFHDTIESGVHMDCRDATTGARLWSSTEGIVTQYDMALSRDGTQVYRSNGSGGSNKQRIIAYDTADGTVLWNYTDLNDVVNRIMSTRDDELVILAAKSGDDRTHAIRKSDGTRVWTAPTDDCEHLQMSPNDDLVWALRRGADLYKLDRATGDILCQNTTDLDANTYFPQAIDRQ